MSVCEFVHVHTPGISGVSFTVPGAAIFPRSFNGAAGASKRIFSGVSAGFFRCSSQPTADHATRAFTSRMRGFVVSRAFGSDGVAGAAATGTVCGCCGPR